MSRVVVVRVLPKDENGIQRCRQCFLVKSPTGAITSPTGRLAKPKNGEKHYPFLVPGYQAYIACQPKRANVNPMNRNSETHVTLRTDDPRVVTCPECMATQEWKDAMAQFDNLLAVGVG
jgi:hypothetical protein